MTLFEILTKFGTPALLRFLALVLAFLALHLLRSPLQALVWVLTALMRGVDSAVAARLAAASEPPSFRRPMWTREATV